MVTAAGLIHAARQKNRCNDVPQCWPCLALWFGSPMTVPHSRMSWGFLLRPVVSLRVYTLQVLLWCAFVIGCKSSVKAAFCAITNTLRNRINRKISLVQQESSSFHPQLQDKLVIRNTHTFLYNPADLSGTVMVLLCQVIQRQSGIVALNVA